METLAMNSLRATFWLDQWLSALGKMVDKEKHPKLMEMLVSGGKSLRHVCQQETALWAEIILKKKKPPYPTLSLLPRMRGPS